MDFVAIDFETANECRNSACAVGLTRVSNGEIGETDYHLIRPVDLRFEPMNVSIHRITADMVSESPRLDEVWPVIKDFIGDNLLVAHNASFDLSVLRHSLYSVGVAVPCVSYLCSVKLSRMVWPKLASYTLSYLAATHGIELDHHHALSDSLAAAKLVLLARDETKPNFLREFATSCGVTIGEVYSNEEWTPSSAPGYRQTQGEAELALPEGYDITTHPFHNKTMVFTGKMELFTRPEVERIVTTLGAFPRSSVSRKTDYVVAGDQDLRVLAEGAMETTKLQWAKELISQGSSLQLITEEDFSELLFTPMK